MNTSQLVMLAGAVAGLTILMISTHKRLRDARNRTRSPVRTKYTDLKRESESRRDLERVMLELDQLARQVHGRLDTRFAKLEAVIRDADERIERLSRLVRAADGGETIDVTLQREDVHEPAGGPASSRSNDPGAPGEACPTGHAAIHRLAESGLSPMEVAQEVGKGVGEVELILALHRTKQAAQRPRA